MKFWTNASNVMHKIDDRVKLWLETDGIIWDSAFYSRKSIQMSRLFARSFLTPQRWISFNQAPRQLPLEYGPDTFALGLNQSQPAITFNF